MADKVDAAERLRTHAFLRRFHREVEEETAHARGKFTRARCDLHRNSLPREAWITAIVEEVGKLTRCCNKLAIAEVDDERERWTREGWHRLVTTASLIRRMAERWDGKEHTTFREMK